ncbi:miniconductance mechanosensitive channel MscM [Xenorhabdus sp. 42]|uniref:Miniconductance mechanosensitive channel MscM n=1 Tax=Xenorhabdus szentirmaii TaxID=290112 RepID=A0AAW3YWD8_9GAMM|nr:MULTISPECIES: miniconductance mechanosensitive channel MscM [Xenorhabdus]MBD2800658.1 miniconductance mechanosensitive channel MscM [Xenorhabdus sp. M]MBD2819703.1 miniconductance mechanosensitive channel MscM [Xenorhabdus sp. 42]PHM42901.1 miniconductance mechanosensitive channel MscM [Xenorhabdus szentirmaii]
MRLIISLLLSLLIVVPALAAIPQLNETQLKQELKQMGGSKEPQDAEIAQTLQGALNWINDTKSANERTQSYQKAIDDFPAIIKELRQKILAESDTVPPIPANQPTSNLEQQIIQISSQLLDQGRLLQQEQDKIREISDSMNQLPQQQVEAKRLLAEATSRLQSLGAPTTPLAEAQLSLAQAEVNARKAVTTELEMAQLSANSRQEISRIRAELFKKRYQRLDLKLQQLRSQLNIQRQQKAESALEHTEMLAEQSGGKLPQFLLDELQQNRHLSQMLSQQTQKMDVIGSQQRKAASDILQVRQTLNTIREQAQWLNDSTALGEALRTQVTRIPDMPKSQQLDSNIVELRVERLKYEEMLERSQHDTDQTSPSYNALTPAQKQVYESLNRTRKELLNSLISGYDNEILELTKLKVTTSQLNDALKEVQDATHRYLFWVADVNPISLNYPLLVVQDLTRLLSLDTFSQLGGAIHSMLTTQDTLLYLLGTLLLVIFSISSHRQYHAFLERSSNRIGKVTQDHFSLTLRTVFWSVIAALPLPMLWSAIGYGLQNAWQYPMANAIGDGVRDTTPVLWIFMLSGAFAHPNGLFIAHFRWPEERIKRAMRFYRLSIFLIVPLMMALITFNHYSDREFTSTLGRLCFVMLCISLSLVTSSLKRAGVPLYMDKHGSGENIVNSILWWILLSAPILAAFASILGFLQTSQALLGRLETSVAIWFFLLVIYHIIRRWMLIQRRKIAFERAKQRRAEILAQRAKSEDDSANINSSVEGSIDVEEPIIDLDAISAQSLGLVRSILTMTALVSLILLWSELHSAFSFLEKIRLWDVSTTINGVETVQPITMGSILIAILVIVITAQLVRNLPALLELALLQHLELTPGTGYAITTLTKYSITLIGGLVGFSLVGIEWAKLQWLIAAMGVGLGFGLQEIFANIISGLIILFEKPIRIGDTVTIRGLTGSITKINTRATTLSDWDRKEIIVPNRAFITEQFINWSLSDTITRIVLTIPVPADTESAYATDILMSAAKNSPLILDNPTPEVYLVDLQQGIQIYELRAYAAEMGHRMPARHEVNQHILQEFRKHNITLPFPPFQAHVDIFGQEIRSSMMNASGRNPPRKSGAL